MRKITDKVKKRFYELVKAFHNESNLSYIEAICTIIDLLDVKYPEVVRLMDNELKAEVKKEAIERRLIKSDREEDLEKIFWRKDE